MAPDVARLAEDGLPDRLRSLVELLEEVRGTPCLDERGWYCAAALRIAFASVTSLSGLRL